MVRARPVAFIATRVVGRPRRAVPIALDSAGRAPAILVRGGLAPPPMIEYDAVNEAVLYAVPASAARVLDLGCGTGALGAALKRLRGCAVVGITHSEAEAARARTRLDAVRVADLERAEFDGLGSFDCVVCSHVLEHLRNPAEVLGRLRRAVAPSGELLVALPNVLHWRQRIEFLRGRFRYTDGGLMDRTHVAFYDWQTARELVTGAGYALLDASADGGFPLSRLLGAPGRALDHAALATAPGLFATQFLVRARPRAPALDRREGASELRAPRE